MPKGIPAGITRAHVLLALKDLDSGDRGNFGPSTTYDLFYQRRRYPPKAVLGLAAKHLTGKAGQPEDFSGGEQSACFAVLRKLRFRIERKDARNRKRREGREDRRDWSEAENRAIVKDYFAMLRAETAGEPYSKTAHRQQLLPLLNGRNEHSIERKHQNISSVLRDLGFRWIQGYKPAPHRQGPPLVDVVIEFLEQDTIGLDIQDSMERVPDVDPGHRGSFASMVVEPPVSAIEGVQKASRLRQPRKYDFRARDEANRALGRKGEELIVAYEKWRLEQANRPDLARQIMWVADAEGDGAGYDLESRNADGSKIYIEVKTTNCGKDFPFLLTANELNASRLLGKAFWLYRVYELNREPKIYRINGDLSQVLSLTPAVFESRGVKPLNR